MGERRSYTRALGACPSWAQQRHPEAQQRHPEAHGPCQATPCRGIPGCRSQLSNSLFLVCRFKPPSRGAVHSCHCSKLLDSARDFPARILQL